MAKNPLPLTVDDALLIVQGSETGNGQLAKIRANIAIAVVLILFIYVTGAVIYHNLEGWTWLESIYFMTATFTTVGYGDIVPKSDYGRLFTIIIIWLGISTALFLLYNIMAYRETVVDKQIRDNFKRFKNFFSNKIEKQKTKKAQVP